MSRTLIVGGTGFIGSFVTRACLDAARPTFLLVRPFSVQKPFVAHCRDMGAVVIPGVISDQALMEKILDDYKIECVVSLVGGANILDQIALVKAIRAVRHVKRFLPSEFGHDIDRADPVEPGLTMYNEKRTVRRFVEECGVPYTYICCNSIAAWPYHNNTHPSEIPPPLDRFVIYGDGTVRAYFVDGTDIGRLTERTLDDGRTVNKTVHFQPAANMLNLNEMATLWEMKIGKKLPRVIMTEDDLLTGAREYPIPKSIVAAITHDIFIRGCQIYELDDEKDVDVSLLYPEVSFKSVDECFENVIKDNPLIVAVPKQSVPTANQETVILAA